MLINILYGLPLMVLCLLSQSLLFGAAAHYYTGHEYLVESPSYVASLIVVNGVMLLVIGNLVQIALWALLFQFVGEFEQFQAAFYHSAVNFSTLGYGDLVMTDKHRLLGPLEAVNGVIMIGVSTAVLMTAFQDAIHKTRRARNGEAS